MMLGLQQENPDAFHRNNISGLKQGAVLSIPSEQQFFELEPRAAKNNILAQIERWKRGDLENSPAIKSPAKKQTQIQQVKSKPEETASDTPRTTITDIATTSGKITTSIPPIRQPSVSADELIRIQKINTRLEAIKLSMSDRIETLHKEVGERNKTIETLLVQFQKYAQKTPASTTTKASVITTTPKPHNAGSLSAPQHPPSWKERLWIPAAMASAILFIILLLLLRGQKPNKILYTPYIPTKAVQQPSPNKEAPKQDKPKQNKTDTQPTPPKISDNKPAPPIRIEGVDEESTTDVDDRGIESNFSLNADQLKNEINAHISRHQFDQAEALSKLSILAHPGNQQLKAKLLELYAQRKAKEKFCSFLEQVKDDMIPEHSEIWCKALKLGSELAPEHPVIQHCLKTGRIEAQNELNDSEENEETGTVLDIELEISNESTDTYPKDDPQ